MSISLSDPASVGLSAARLERIAPAMQTFVDKRGFRPQHDARAPRHHLQSPSRLLSVVVKSGRDLTNEIKRTVRAMDPDLAV